MGYEIALEKAWNNLEEISKDRNYSVRFLSDEYSVDVENRRILSLSCNVPAKDHISILILHYLVKKIDGLKNTIGEWVAFKELEGGQGYYPAFKKRVIDRIVKKYGSNLGAFSELESRFKAKRINIADTGLVFDMFDEVPILVTISKGDEEFGPEANVLFDRGIKELFCTEDVVILSEFLAHSI